VGVGTVAPGVLGNFEVQAVSGNMTGLAIKNNATGSILYGGSYTNISMDSQSASFGITQVGGSGFLYGGPSSINFLQNSNAPMTFTTNATERLRISATGVLGVGTSTPSAWNTAVKALDVGTLTSLYDGSGFGLTSNAYYSAGANWTYKTTAVASVLTSSAGALYYYNAPSGTAGTTLTLTERFQVSAAGLVGIGKTPAYQLDVNGTVNGQIFASWNNTFTATSGGAAASFGNIGLFYVYWQNAGFSIFGSDLVLCNVYAGATVIASNAYGAAPTRTYSSSPYLAVSFTGAGGPWAGHYTLIQ
jgi:hypothetical protein